MSRYLKRWTWRPAEATDPVRRLHLRITRLHTGCNKSYKLEKIDQAAGVRFPINAVPSKRPPQANVFARCNRVRQIQKRDLCSLRLHE